MYQKYIDISCLIEANINWKIDKNGELIQELDTFTIKKIVTLGYKVPYTSL